MTYVPIRNSSQKNKKIKNKTTNKQINKYFNKEITGLIFNKNR